MKILLTRHSIKRINEKAPFINKRNWEQLLSVIYQTGKIKTGYYLVKIIHKKFYKKNEEFEYREYKKRLFVFKATKGAIILITIY